MSIGIPPLSQDVRDGITPRAANPSYCPDGVARAWLQDLVRRAGELGWDEAWWQAAGALDPEERAALELAVGVEGREGWQYLVSLSPDAVVLDLGSGWGPMSCALARRVAEIYSVDPSLERLQLLRARAQQRGLDNFHYLLGGDALPLPFPDAFFDLVKVGEALERLPCLIAGNPRRVQRQLLQEIRRVLKPTGRVYAGVENRFARKFFQGKSQGANPRYVTLMPRWLAHLVCLLRRGMAYRTYAYSAAGIERLFRQAGFADVQTLLLSPDRRQFDRVMARGDAVQLASLFKPRSAWKELGKRLLAKAGVLSRLAPAFGVVCGSPLPDTRERENGHYFLEQIVSQVSRNQQVRYRITETSLRDYGGCVLFLQDRDEPARKAVLKLALDDGAENHLDRARRNLAQMAETLKHATPQMPRILENGIVDGHAYVLEDRLQGCNGWQMMARGWYASRLADIVGDFLEGWMRATRSTVRLSDAEFCRWVPYQPEHWQRLAGPQTAELVGELIPALRTYMVGQERVVVASHGDFSLGNILFHAGQPFQADARVRLASLTCGAIKGIVDWDSADPRGLPLVDAISLSQYRDETSFDLGFPDDFAEAHPVDSLAGTLRRVSTCPEHARLASIRSEYGYNTDRDAYLALFLLFLKRHQPGSLALRKQTRKWVEAFRLLLAVA